VRWNFRWAAGTMYLSLGLLSVKPNKPLVTWVIIVLYTQTQLFFGVSQQWWVDKFTGVGERSPSSSVYPESVV